MGDKSRQVGCNNRAGDASTWCRKEVLCMIVCNVEVKCKSVNLKNANESTESRMMERTAGAVQKRDKSLPLRVEVIDPLLGRHNRPFGLHEQSTTSKTA